MHVSVRVIYAGKCKPPHVMTRLKIMGYRLESHKSSRHAVSLVSNLNLIIAAIHALTMYFFAQRPTLPALCSLLELANFAQISAGRLSACLASCD